MFNIRSKLTNNWIFHKYNPFFYHFRSLTFTAEHDRLRETTRKIIENHVNPYLVEWEAKGIFDGHKVFKKFGEAGLLGICRETQYNGLNLDYSYTVAFFEEISNILVSGVGSAIGVQCEIVQPALEDFGSDELKRTFLSPSISGDLIGCLGITEPSGGSDVSALRSTAKKVGDDYIINGEKMWITNGYQADWICLLANTSVGDPHKNKSLFCFPMDTPGVKKARIIDKMGLKCSDTAHLFFEDVRIPKKFLLGEEGMGFTYQMMQFQDERLCAGILGTASMEKIINHTIDYCRQRKTFGIPLIDNQYIHFTLAELQAEVECLKSLVYRAADKVIEGEDVTYLASIIKLKTGRLGRKVVDKCLQFWGAMGYSEELLVSRAFRDFRALSIAGGSDEMMISIICKFLGILPKKKAKV